ncbi:SapC family protein [Methylobacterium nigriterrae]|uniref:SapC family protein n=1 Tax=Methylobacterium nigriterrae TaxID=3127512 RepID=UPI00301374B4
MNRSVRPLQQNDPARLYELTEYPALGHVQLLPIVAVEAQSLAHHYPLVWRRVGEAFELVALISLSAPHDLTLRRDLERGLPRPLLLEAYPFSVVFADANDSQGAVLIEDTETSADTAGAPVFLENGALSPAATRRISLLEVYAGDSARTAAYTRAMAERGLLVDWPLRLRIGDEGVEIDGLCVLAPPAARREALPALVTDHGFPLAELVTLHDLSLFNLQRLVDRHRAERGLRAEAGGSASGSSMPQGAPRP